MRNRGGRARADPDPRRAPRSALAQAPARAARGLVPAPARRAARAPARSEPASRPSPREKRRSFGCAVGHHVVDAPAARADPSERLAGEHLLDAPGQGWRLSALGTRLLCERLISRLVLVLLITDRRAAPRAE